MNRVLSVCCWILLVSPSMAVAQSLPTELATSDVAPIKVPTSPEADVGTPGNPPTGMFLGSLSCASASCHGNPRRESVLGSAAHFFLDRDKHQLGGAVLREKRSQDIAARLNLPLPAWETRECLVCHAPAAIHETDRQTVPTRLAEGVGCESCHGPARQWLGLHHSAQWKQPEIWPGARKSQAGFRETKQLLARINLCADCHVGNAEQSVTHDFIAAGHPRLVFEYSSHQSQMPVHWRRFDDRLRTPVANHAPASDRSTYEATNWLVGQLVNAEHELDILAAAAGNPNRVWPELAQYDCFGCHHELNSPSWRRTRAAWNLRPGELPWGTWNLGLVEETQRHLPARLSEKVVVDQTEFVTAMRSLPADRTRVAGLIAKLRPELADATRHLSQTRMSAENLTTIRDRLLEADERLTEQGWDRSTQLYLAAVALDKGVTDAHGRGNRVDPARLEAYLRLRELLSFRDTTTAVPTHPESPYRLESNRPAIRQQFQQLQSSDGNSEAPVGVKRERSMRTRASEEK
ncbi:MAG: multiheme c-type cytochrome [Planctomycetota bacterium]